MLILTIICNVFVISMLQWLQTLQLHSFYQTEIKQDVSKQEEKVNSEEGKEGHAV